jgi:hypothetical protein
MLLGYLHIVWLEYCFIDQCIYTKIATRLHGIAGLEDKMRKLSLCFLLLGLGIGVLANPMPPIIIERAWFDAGEELNIQVGTDLAEWMLDPADFTFTTSSGSYYFPAGYTFPTGAHYTLNLSQLLPSFSIQRNSDFLQLEITDGYAEEILRWGPGNGIDTDLHPLLDGQSAVHFYQSILDGGNLCWSKDAGVNLDNIYCPVSRCTLNVAVVDTGGDPVPGLPVYMSYAGFYDGLLQYYAIGNTNDLGTLSQVIFPARPWIRIVDPANGSAVVDQWFYPEPGESLQITATVSSSAADDHLSSLIPGVLSVQPNVLKLSGGSILRISFDKPGRLDGTPILSLFDLRGRLAVRTEFPVAGEMNWQLPDLDSGIYFLSLDQGGSRLGLQKLIVLK